MLLPRPPGEAHNTLYYSTKFVPREASITSSKGGNAGKIFTAIRGPVPAKTASIAPSKGGDAGKIFPAIRGHVPATSIAPTKGGDAGKFFWAIRGHVPAKLRHLPQRKGGDAVRFPAPPPREVQVIFFLSRLPAFFAGLDAALILNFWSFDSKSFEIKMASRPQML